MRNTRWALAIAIAVCAVPATAVAQFSGTRNPTLPRVNDRFGPSPAGGIGMPALPGVYQPGADFNSRSFPGMPAVPGFRTNLDTSFPEINGGFGRSPLTPVLPGQPFGPGTPGATHSLRDRFSRTPGAPAFGPGSRSSSFPGGQTDPFGRHQPRDFPPPNITPMPPVVPLDALKTLPPYPVKIDPIKSDSYGGSDKSLAPRAASSGAPPSGRAMAIVLVIAAAAFVGAVAAGYRAAKAQ